MYTLADIGFTITMKGYIQDLHFNLFCSFEPYVMDQVGYYNHFDNGKWKFSKPLLVVTRRILTTYDMYKTHEKANRQHKFNAIKDFERTLHLKVKATDFFLTVEFPLSNKVTNRREMYIWRKIWWFWACHNW